MSQVVVTNPAIDTSNSLDCSFVSDVGNFTFLTGIVKSNIIREWLSKNFLATEDAELIEEKLQISAVSVAYTFNLTML
jgi:hypothetical protein